MKYLFLTSACLILYYGLTSFKLTTGPIDNKIDVIVLDPGHGGKDPGTLGGTSKEKDVSLQIVLKVEKMIEENLPGVKVELTRRTDDFIGLMERAKYANDKKADVFVSVHCNANKNKTICGSETYAMGLHKQEANFDIMVTENSSILMEDNHEQKYDGFDPKSEEAYIIFKLQQHASLKQSLLLAEKVEQQFEKYTKRKSRGVKQAGFMVLWKTAMPSVLIETGFLSNSVEEKFMNSKEGQQFIATSIYQAIHQFRQAYR